MTTTETSVTAAPKRSILRSEAAQKLLAFAALIVIFAFFSIVSPFFLTRDNVMGILLATAVNGVLALGVTFVIVTAGIDLSVGTVMTLSAMTTAVAITVWSLPIPIGILVGLLTGTLAGFVNGIIIARMSIPPFVATLGMMMIARGLALVIPAAIFGSVRPIYFSDAPAFTLITMGSIVGSVFPGFPIPNAVLILFVAALIAAFILSKTVLGRYTVAIGSNEEATRLSGVNVANWKTAVYADRRHVAQRRRGHDPRHAHRRLHHQHADQRPAHPRRAAGMADGHHRRDRHPGRLPGYRTTPRALTESGRWQVSGCQGVRVSPGIRRSRT